MLRVSDSISFSMASSSAKTDRHSAKNGAAGHGEPVRGKVSAGDAFGARDGTVVERLAPGKDFHDGGLAGAVRSDQTDPGFWRDQPVGVLKQELVAVALAGAGELDHGCLYLNIADESVAQIAEKNSVSYQGIASARP